MSIIFEERLSDSPYIETITHGYTASAGSTIRPAEVHWHMIFSNHDGHIHPIIVGPLKSSGVVSYGAGAEILWIKFKLGIFMPHLPIKQYMDVETPLPGGAGKSFWLKSSTWQFPNHENVETFIDRLVREAVLVRDPVVDAVLKDQPQAMPSRTVRHRFLRATGLPQSHIHQFERAQRAEALLKQGVSILDTVEDAGYFDQPHLTRALKHWIGYTPAQLLRISQPACQTVQDSHRALAYDTGVLETTG